VNELEPTRSGFESLAEAVRSLAEIFTQTPPVQATAERVDETPLQIES
jgi:hypothetical protein